MELEEKTVFEKVLKSIKDNKELYNYYPRTSSRDKERFTVLGLADLACNHLFDDYPELFNITKHQGHIIREYFHKNKQHKFIIELYREFPNVFEGEKTGFFHKKILEELAQNKIPLI